MGILAFQKPDKVIMIQSSETDGLFEFRPLEPGYGITIGNALRRILLRSLEGCAISRIRIDNVWHEFATIPGVREDVTEIVLNLKQVRLKLHGDGPKKGVFEMRGKRVDTYGDFRELCDRKDVDVVFCVTPDHWHSKIAIDAMRAGKDVYCEKPLTLVIGEGKPMIDAARQHKRVVQTGTMQRSGAEFQLAVDLVRKGIVGKISAVNVTLPSPNWIARAGKPVPNSAPPEGFDYDRWLGPAPLRPYNKNHVHYLFRFFWDYSGGQQTNFGAHHLDIAQWGLGMDESGPVAVEGSAKFNADGWYETPDTTEIRYTYANGVVMTCRQKLNTKNPDQGTEFIGEKGSLFVYRGGIVTTPKELLKGIEMPKITSSQANFAHVNNFYDCIRSRKSPNADVSIGHRSATVCHLGNIAVRTGRKIQWDPATETIVGDADATKWVMKEYRKPYKLG